MKVCVAYSVKLKNLLYLNESAQTTNIQPIREAIKIIRKSDENFMLTASSEAYIQGH